MCIIDVKNSNTLMMAIVVFLFRAIPYNDTKFNAWVAEGVAPAVPGVRRLYKTLLSLGIKPVFISGTKEVYRQVRISNLKNVGYRKWEKLILK